jgi:hypothetical protein
MSCLDQEKFLAAWTNRSIQLSGLTLLIHSNHIFSRRVFVRKPEDLCLEQPAWKETLKCDFFLFAFSMKPGRTKPYDSPHKFHTIQQIDQQQVQVISTRLQNIECCQPVFG